MSPTTRLGTTLWRGIAAAVVLGLVVAVGLWWTLKDAGTNTATAYFPTTIGLYEDNTVRVRGVAIGTVSSIEPQGDRVKVTMTYDSGVRIPADANAVIIAPSLVSDRYIQFAPYYAGGPQLEDGAVIDIDRTAVPLEIDDLAETLIEVSSTLGPEGANEDGALSDMLDTLAANLDGNGPLLNETLTKLGQAQGTLAGSADDLFATVTNLAEFSQTLAESDDEVRRFQRQLAEVSDFLADERENFAETIELLGPTLAKVHTFIEDNKDGIQANVDKLADVTQVLVDKRAELAEIFDIGPVALGNVINSYNATKGTLDARANINELSQPPIMMICELVKQVEGIEGFLALCDELSTVLDPNLPSVGEVIEMMQRGTVPLPMSGGER